MQQGYRECELAGCIKLQGILCGNSGHGTRTEGFRL
jgi:hypothetical protein